MKFRSSSRRSFIKQAAVLSAAGFIAPLAASSFDLQGTGDHTTFLFQGDSITDGNRTRNLDWNHVLGHGYAYLIASRLWYKYTKKDLHFFNRGISGNTVPALIKRWQEDTIALKPDVLSILIGVNDTTAAVAGNPAFTLQSFEQDYRALLTQTLAALPNIQLVIMEPFMLPVGKVKDKWEDNWREIQGRQLIAKKMAEEFNAIFVPLQQAFTEAANNPSAIYWLWDGVHPMPNGHELIARAWLKHVGKKLKFIG